jgi:hypothetical protein
MNDGTPKEFAMGYAEGFNDACKGRDEPIAHALDLLEEAVGYTGCESHSPSLTLEIRSFLLKCGRTI